MALVRLGVGSEVIFSYIFRSERCSRPSCMYLLLSSTTMPEPLSAALMTRVWSLASLESVCCSFLVRLGWEGLFSSDCSCAFTLFRYASMAGLAGGGIQADFLRKGCGSGPLWSLKCHLSLFDLSNLLYAASNWSLLTLLVGTYVSPLDRTSISEFVRFLERFVMYFCLCI